MKCGTWIRKELKGRKNKVFKIVECLPDYYVRKGLKKVKEGMEQCDGDIVVTVEAKHYDYSGAELEVYSYCNKCGFGSFPEIPNSPDEFSKFVTELVAGVDRDALVPKLKLPPAHRTKEQEDKAYSNVCAHFNNVKKMQNRMKEEKG